MEPEVAADGMRHITSLYRDYDELITRISNYRDVLGEDLTVALDQMLRMQASLLGLRFEELSKLTEIGAGTTILMEDSASQNPGRD